MFFFISTKIGFDVPVVSTEIFARLSYCMTWVKLTNMYKNDKT